MSLAEIKSAVDQLSAREMAELAAFIRDRDNAAWDQELVKPKDAERYWNIKPAARPGNIVAFQEAAA